MWLTQFKLSSTSHQPKNFQKQWQKSGKNGCIVAFRTVINILKKIDGMIVILMMINLGFFSFVINLFTQKFPFLRIDRDLSNNIHSNCYIARWNFNLEMLVTSRLEIQVTILIFLPHPFAILAKSKIIHEHRKAKMGHTDTLPFET